MSRRDSSQSPKNKNVGRLYQYWFENYFGDYLAIWQVIPKTEEQRERDPRNEGNHIMLLFWQHHSAECHDVCPEPGRTMVFGKHHMSKSETWKPVLKDDLQIKLMLELEHLK